MKLLKYFKDIVIDFIGIIKLIPNPVLRFATWVLAIITVIIIIVELIQNYHFIPMFFDPFAMENFQKFQFDLDFWGFAFGLSTFVIGLVITAHLDKKQNEDDQKLQHAANELLENQRQNHNSYIQVLEKAEIIVANSDRLKIMTFTTTMGAIYSKDINELNLIHNKKSSADSTERPYVDLSVPEHKKIKDNLEKVIDKRIGKLREKILVKSKVELITYCDCDHGTNTAENDFLNKILLAEKKPDNSDQLITDIKNKHCEISQQIGSSKNIEHIKMRDKIPLQMFIGRRDEIIGKQEQYHECLIIFENLGDQNHILAFSSVNEKIVRFFESMYVNTPNRHGVCSHLEPIQAVQTN